jgi:hypothetical protein
MVDLLARLFALNARSQAMFAVAFTGVGILIVLLVAYAGVSLFVDEFGLLREQRIVLGQTVALSRQLKSIDQSALDAPPDALDIFLAESNPEVASAELQNWLNEQALDVGAEIQSVESSVGDIKEKQAFVALKADISGNYKALQAIIARIETRKPMLLVYEADLRADQTEAEGIQPMNLQIAFRGLVRGTRKAGGK